MEGGRERVSEGGRKKRWGGGGKRDSESEEVRCLWLTYDSMATISSSLHTVMWSPSSSSSAGAKGGGERGEGAGGRGGEWCMCHKDVKF